MNGRGFYDWYLGQLLNNNSPAYWQLPFGLQNPPGNMLGNTRPQVTANPVNQKLAEMGMLYSAPPSQDQVPSLLYNANLPRPFYGAR